MRSTLHDMESQIVSELKEAVTESTK